VRGICKTWAEWAVFVPQTARFLLKACGVGVFLKAIELCNIINFTMKSFGKAFESNLSGARLSSEFSYDPG